MDDLDFVETCLVDNYNDKWIFNSKSTNHVYISSQWFRETSLVGEGYSSLRLENGERVSLKEIGQIVFILNNDKTFIFVRLFICSRLFKKFDFF